MADRLIAGRFDIDLMRPLPQAGGGFAAFAAWDARAPRSLMAVQVAPGKPPRAAALRAAESIEEGVLAPIAHGPGPGAGGEAYYIVCMAPPGPSLAAAPRQWQEAELLECLLRPAAQTLCRFASCGITHRSIRLDNVFQAAPGQPVVLGQCWAGPAGANQTALSEPPYSALCFPAGRGDGSIADDVYALGVLMLILAIGSVPLEGMSESGIVGRKLALGSYAAIAEGARLPPVIADLARGMLAEDPEHRPAPTLLLDPVAARSRRLATRPPRRASFPIRVGELAASNARTLAFALATDPEAGLAALRTGAVDEWLRRGLGDEMMAARLDEVARHRNPRIDSGEEALVLMRAVAALDPLAPLTWRGVAVWPDGLGPALAAAGEDSSLAERFLEIISAEATAAWALAREDRCDVSIARAEARRIRALLGAKPTTRGRLRLSYVLNPLLCCVSPLLAGRAVARLADLLPALEGCAAQKQDRIFDGDIAAFVGMRAERGGEAELAAAAAGDGPGAALARLDLLARLQARQPMPVPALAGLFAAAAEELLADWRNTERRANLAARLASLAEAGDLAPMMALLRDPAGLAADRAEAEAALARLTAIDAELAEIENTASARAHWAAGIGQELATGLALSALAIASAAALLT